MRFRPAFRGATLMLLLAAVSVAAHGAPPEPPTPRPLPDLSGTPRDWTAHQGRILVLNFWATWCVPCVEELPMLEEIGRTWGPRGVDVVLVSADGPGREAEVRRFVETHGLRSEVRTGATTEDMEALGLGSALPATALFDRDGYVAFRLRGPLRRDDLIERLEWLLGTRTDAPPEAQLVAPESAGAAAAPEPDHVHDDAEDHHHPEDHQHEPAGPGRGSLVPS